MQSSVALVMVRRSVGALEPIIVVPEEVPEAPPAIRCFKCPGTDGSEAALEKRQ
jgi:hypothetical protein